MSKSSSLSLPESIEKCHELLIHFMEVTEKLLVRVEKLEQENQQLKERLNINSDNSSLPPSKSLKKKKSTGKASGKKSGGQQGHKGHFRELLPAEKVDAIVVCPVASHCDCGGRISKEQDAQIHQVYELPVQKLHVTEYVLEKGRCICCRRRIKGSLPSGVTMGITGSRLTAFLLHMVARYQLSRRELQELLKEQFNFRLSLGTVFNKQKLANRILEKPVGEILKKIRENPCTNMDETGHNRDGKKQWLWGAMSNDAAFFRVDKSRGKKVISEIMGDYKGIIISDRYAGYNHFQSSQRQLCWAHLKRDFTRVSEKSNPLIARLGKNLLDCKKQLFERWHAFRNGDLNRQQLQQDTQAIRKRTGELLEQGSYTDPALGITRFCKNLLHYFGALWTFLEAENVEPTNNHAERGLRQAVIWRKKYFGTRSDYGSEFVGKILSFNTTCKLQSQNAFHQLTQVIDNWFNQKTVINFV
jgi:transposase